MARTSHQEQNVFAKYGWQIFIQLLAVAFGYGIVHAKIENQASTITTIQSTIIAGQTDRKAIIDKVVQDQRDENGRIHARLDAARKVEVDIAVVNTQLKGIQTTLERLDAKLEKMEKR